MPLNIVVLKQDARAKARSLNHNMLMLVNISNTQTAYAKCTKCGAQAWASSDSGIWGNAVVYKCEETK